MISFRWWRASISSTAHIGGRPAPRATRSSLCGGGLRSQAIGLHARRSAVAQRRRRKRNRSASVRCVRCTGVTVGPSDKSLPQREPPVARAARERMNRQGVP